MIVVEKAPVWKQIAFVPDSHARRYALPGWYGVVTEASENEGWSGAVFVFYDSSKAHDVQHPDLVITPSENPFKTLAEAQNFVDIIYENVKTMVLALARRIN